MKRSQVLLGSALFFTTLSLFAYFLTVLNTDPIGDLYRSTVGLDRARQVAQVAAIVATICLFVTSAFIAIPTAFKPTTRWRKPLLVLPIYLLGFTLAGIVSGLIGIGTTGKLFYDPLTEPGPGGVTFAVAWIAIGGVLSVIAVTLAALLVEFGEGVLRATRTAATVTAIPSVIAGAAMLVSVALVSTSQPGGPPPPPAATAAATGNAAPVGTLAATGNAQPAATPAATKAAQPAATPAATGNAQPAATQAATPAATKNAQPAATQEATPAATKAAQPAITPAATGNAQPAATPAATSASQPVSTPAATQNAAGGPGSGSSGGPGGGAPNTSPGDVVRQFRAGGILMGICALIGLVSTIGLLRVNYRSTPASRIAAAAPQPSATPINFSREVRAVVISGLAITVIAFALIQIVPVPRTNPRNQDVVHWDSPQTEQLWTRACANCHSNDTTWPWYAYVAPSSWLTALHVTDARKQFNMSDLNTVPQSLKQLFHDSVDFQVSGGTMPPPDYLILHPEARLSDQEKKQIIQGLENTLSQ